MDTEDSEAKVCLTCATAGAKAAKGSSKGKKKEHKLFAETVVERLQMLPSHQKAYCMGMFTGASFAQTNLDNLMAAFEAQEAKAHQRSVKYAQKMSVLAWNVYYSQNIN